jgi:radical SAM superfamily enzyme YgiQ (UPF0313 family)
MKILLINPNQKRPRIPPIGLDYLYDSVKADHEVSFFDFGIKHPSGLRSVLQQEKPEIIGLTLRNLDDVDILRQQEFVTSLNKWIRTIKKHSDAKIVLGGAGFSFMPYEIMQATEADIGVVGDGEFTFPRLLDNLDRLETVPNILFKKSQNDPQIIQTKRSIDPIDQLKPFSRSLVNYKNYHTQGTACNIQTLRGCNRSCIYCPEPHVTGSKLRARPPEKVVEEFKTLSSYGINKKIFIVDSEFNLLPEHTYNIAKAILDNGLKMEWACTMTPKNVSLELLSIMKKAGCVLVIWSLDTASEKMIGNLRKDFNVSDIFRVSGYCDQINLTYHHNFLFGGPGEDFKTIDESYTHISRTNADFIGVSAGIRVYPQTALYDIAVKEGELSEDTDMLFPVYYKETFVKETLWPYILKMFSHLENCIINGVSINETTKESLNKLFSVTT